MRVALLCPYDLGSFGGVQDQVLRLARWLTEAGHDAWIVGPGAEGPPGARLLGRSVPIPANRSRAPITLNPLVARTVRAAVADAEVVHVHEPFMPVASVAAMMVARSPVVATFHADPSPLVRRLYRIGSPVLRGLVRRASAVTAVSPVAAGAIAHLADAAIVPNGLDLEEYRRREPPKPGRVLFVGRDEPRKGLDVLLQAWPYVRAEIPAARLRVVGTGRDSGPAGVDFLGRVDEASKRAELSAAAVLAAPNLGAESFGIVVAEGMASACAVVASDIEAFRATLGGSGRLVPPGDVPALAGAIVAACGDAGAGAEAAAAAERFGRVAVLGGYLGAYRRALEAAPDGR